MLFDTPVIFVIIAVGVLFFLVFGLTAIIGILGIQFRDRIISRFKH